MKKIIILTGIVALASTGSIRGEDAKTIFEAKCAACHAKSGKGDTAMGKKLEVRDYTDAKVQAELKDDAMIKAIKEGVTKDGKSVMKGFGDKLSDEDIKALVAYIRSLKK